MKRIMDTSENFTKLMIEHEAEILKVYLDPVGLPTMGIGHLLTPEERKTYKVGQKITLEESRRLFAKDTAWAKKAVNKLVLADLTQNQFDALVSLIFNIGEQAFKTSTLLKQLNRGEYKKAADSFNSWVYSRGKKFKGLVIRRGKERALFLKASHTAANPTNEPALISSEQAETVKESAPTLRKGSTGKWVKLLQEKLGIAADGIFGKDTEKAVKDFQKRNKLTADGVAGKNTWKKLGD